MATLATATPNATGLATQATAGNLTDIASLQRGFNALSQRARLGLMVGVAAFVAIAIALAMWARTPDYKVLFSGLADRDGGAITAALTQMNVPYKISENGAAVLVPADKVHDVRLKLASQGLPKGGTVGFELLENQKFGITQFQEQVNYQRALEGELARSIQALGQVQSARVHLAIPKSTVFLREQQKPTASVLLNLHAGKGLERSQLAGIVHLVSSSVPELLPKNVSVVDQNGVLLSAQADGMDNRLDAKQLVYVQQVEAQVLKRINDLLEPVIGRSNFRAQVTADVDFTESELTDERFKPNGNPSDATIRSTQTNDSASNNASAGPIGIPGALSNQPPTAAFAPINNPPAGRTAAGSQAQSNTPDTAVRNPSATQKSAIVNYEVDKTVRHTRAPVGAVKRLSTAVVLNHRKGVEVGATPAAPTVAELANIAAIVREAMGFREDRGDSLKVTSAPFNVDAEDTTVMPMWKRPETLAFSMEIAKYIFVLLIFAYLIFGVLRPLLRQLASPATTVTTLGALPPGATRAADGTIVDANGEPLDVVLGGTLADPAALSAAQRTLMIGNRITSARELAAQDPKLVANVVRTWIHTGSQTHE